MPRRAQNPPFLLLALAILAIRAPSSARATGCPVEPVALTSARFALVPDTTTPPRDGALEPVTVPDRWRERRPDARGFSRYRLTLDAPDGGGERCGVLLPDVNMNAAVFVNGSWIGDGGSFAEPVAHNFNRPLYFDFPAALLHPGANTIDVLLFAYEHHFGFLGPVRVGPHAVLADRYQSAFSRQIVRIDGLEHRLAARLHLELAVDVLHVRRHGARRDAEQLADLGDAEALGDVRQDLELARGERRVAGARRRPLRLEALQQMARDRCADRRAAGEQLGNRVADVRPRSAVRASAAEPVEPMRLRSGTVSTTASSRFRVGGSSSTMSTLGGIQIF